MKNRILSPWSPLLLLLALVGLVTLATRYQTARAEEEEPPAKMEGESPYFSRATLSTSDGSNLERIVINGPSTPPPGISRATVALEEITTGAGVVLLPVPAYDWYYGCSATSASMIAAYYDRNGYDNIYSGPTNGGVMPSDGRIWGVFSDSYGGRYYQNPLTASRNGLDGRTTRGSIEDYWVYYYAPVATFPDPFITGGWTEHIYGDAIGDYTRTGQSNFSNADGMTTFYEFSDGKATPCSIIDDYVFDDATVGRKLFYEARGYTVTDCYSQMTSNKDPDGFAFTQYMAEIDAGRPVLINVTGHTMVGIGYDSATNKVYLNDTWDNITHSMTWGGSYSGMTMEAVSIVNLSPNDVDVFTLVATTAGTGDGTITSSPAGINCGFSSLDCFENYPIGAQVTLTATPASGSNFTGWSGDCSGAGVCTLTMDESHSVTATFQIYSLTVTKSGTGSGTVTSDPSGINCGSDCSENFPLGTVVTLSAVPATGSYFTGWSGACSGTGTCVVTMDGSKSVAASFQTYKLTVTTAGTGTGMVSSNPAGIDCGSDCSEAYPQNTVVTLTAVPSPSSTFIGWSGACSGTGACVVTMSESKSVTATFTMITYSLNVSLAGSGNGTVKSVPSGIYCGTTCSYSFPMSTTVTLSAWSWTSDFIGWSGACSGAGTCTVTMDSIKDVTASFNIRSYPLSVSKAGTGSGSITSSPAGIDCGSDCSEIFSHGTSVTLTAAPVDGSSFTGWSGGACTGTGVCTLAVTATQSVTATFTLDVVTFNLTVTKAGTGSGTVTSTPIGISCGADCTEAYPSGTTVTLIAAPAADSTFTGWSGACTGTGDCTISITAAQSLSATFTLNMANYNLAVSKTGTGRGTVTSTPAGISCGMDCIESYVSGTLVKLTAVPNTGSVFNGWIGACGGTSTICWVTMNKSKSVSAGFISVPVGAYYLGVTKAGTGTGTVTSSPAGINCGSTCGQIYASGLSIKLTAVASPGSTFTGWSGACGGAGYCWVKMTATRYVKATFILTTSLIDPHFFTQAGVIGDKWLAMDMVQFFWQE